MPASLKTALAAIRRCESDLCRHLLAGLRHIPGLRVYGITDPTRLDRRVPTVSFTMD